MSDYNWCKHLNLSEEDLDDLRFTAYSYLRQGKYDIAASMFEALVVLAPESSYDLQTLGALYLELNRFEEAIRMLDRALQLEGNHSPTLMNLCKAFFSIGKIEEGKKLAQLLEKDHNPRVASVAKALLIAWTT